MRAVPLTVINDGINRLRLKGGARADTLYDLVNGFCTDADTVKCRPGTLRVAELDPITRGLVAFNDELHVFAHEFVEVPDGYQCNVLVHPDSSPYYPIPVEKIHYASPFMGALYVVAEFEDGEIYHYWLQQPEVWQPDYHYAAGTLVEPTEPNGLVFRAGRIGDPYPAWAPNVPRSDGSGSGEEQSFIEPTVYNDFYYECVDTIGENPSSGDEEPVWPTQEGAHVTEFSNGAAVSEEPPAPPEPPGSDTPQAPYRDRYDRGDFR